MMSTHGVEQLPARAQNFLPASVRSRPLNGVGDDLSPTEGWSDCGENCLHDVHIVGNT
jgi:hypothetical protein